MAGYYDISVYQRSYKAALSIYEMTDSLPKEERYNLTDQLRRAAISIPLNIAEGYGRREYVQEFVRFLNIAYGSVSEVKVLLDFAKDLSYIDSSIYDKAKEEYEQISKMLYSFIKTAKQNI